MKESSMKIGFVVYLGENEGLGRVPRYSELREIAAALHQYEELEVSHLMFDCGPSNEATLAQLANAMNFYRRNTYP